MVNEEWDGDSAGGAPSESKLVTTDLVPTPTPPPPMSAPFGLPAPGQPVVPQQQVGLALQFGQQSAEALALQKLTPEGVSDALKRAHDLEGRRLDAGDRQLQRESEQEERQRQRDHQLLVARENRRWTLAWVLLALLVMLVAAVFHASGADAAIKVAKDFGGYVLAFAGGVGAEKIRREWGKRKG